MRLLKGLFAFILTLLLTGSTVAWGQLPSNELEGTWEIVSQELVYPDSVVEQSDQWGKGYKILNSTHFTWARETEDGDEILAGGGRYEYHPESGVYVEHIEFHSDPALKGNSIKFKAHVEGDTWVHVGELDDFQLREVWRRVDPRQVRAELRGDTSSTDVQSADVNE